MTNTLTALPIAKSRLLSAIRGESGAHVLSAVTGAHTYGFASADSDVDVRGIYLGPASSKLGLNPAKEEQRIETMIDGVLVDYVGTEWTRACRNIARSNGNILECLYSPLVLLEFWEVERLRELAKPFLRTQRLVDHYRGFAKGQWQRATNDGHPTAKMLCYAFRTALTGYHALVAGEMQMNLDTLLRWWLKDACEGTAVYRALETKRHNAEHGPIDPSEVRLAESMFMLLLHDFESITPTLVRAPTEEEYAKLEAFTVERALEEE